MPKFVLFIQASAETESQNLPSNEVIENMTKYNEDLVKAGVLLSGEGLLSSHTAAYKVHIPRVSENKPPVAKKGPIENPAVCGWWVLKTKDIDEAAEWAKKIPADKLEDTHIEIRQIAGVDDLGEGFSDDLKEREKKIWEQAQKNV